MGVPYGSRGSTGSAVGCSRLSCGWRLRGRSSCSSAPADQLVHQLQQLFLGAESLNEGQLREVNAWHRRVMSAAVMRRAERYAVHVTCALALAATGARVMDLGWRAWRSLQVAGNAAQGGDAV